MIVLDAILHKAIEPAFALLPARMNSDAARVMMLAIGLQESEFAHRVQMGGGPAKGFWQFERGGGVKGIMGHALSKTHLIALCGHFSIPLDSRAIHDAMETNDVFAAACARLLLYTDMKPLPNLDAKHEDTWQYYFRNWRPGKPHREKWNANYDRARAQVMS